MLWNGFTGIDFGHHWDEPFAVSYLSSSISRQVWLPGYYNYPSGLYWMGVSGALPEMLTAAQSDDWSASITRALENPDYLLRLRQIFVVVTALTSVWLYMATLAILRSRIAANRAVASSDLSEVQSVQWGGWVALLAAAIFATSWETNYHARWFAPDNLIWMTSTLTLLFAILTVIHPDQKRWLWLTAFGAGLVIGSKYSVGLVVLYVIIAAFFVWRYEQKPVHCFFVLLVLTGFITSITYFVTTPGTLLDTQAFLRDLRYEINHYSTGHQNHTVSAGLGHFRLNLTYLGTVLVSPYRWVALSFSALMFVGAYALWRQSWRLCVLVLCFPVVYLLYISTQRVMIIRNVIVLFPTMCLLMALGTYFIWQKLPTRPLQYGFALSLVILLGLSAVWNINATRTIDDRHNMSLFVSDMQRYIDQQSQDTFCLSNSVSGWVDAMGLTKPENVIGGGQNAQYVVFMMSDVPSELVTANRADLTETWFGTYEVNYNYYPSWWGDDRIIVMSTENARRYNATINECL